MFGKFAQNSDTIDEASQKPEIQVHFYLKSKTRSTTDHAPLIRNIFWTGNLGACLLSRAILSGMTCNVNELLN